tara:strand:+ start:417 stop:563 length:147 start_codon:yes stop_codon:yes gene_type:complete
MGGRLQSGGGEVSFKDDIEAAERKLLIISWIGVVSALGLIGYTLLTFP